MSKSIVYYNNLDDQMRTPFTPEYIHLEAWFDSADQTTLHENTVANRLTQWDDKSSFLRHVSISNSTKEPETGTRTYNGLNVVDFDNASGHFLQNKSVTSTQTLSHDLYFFAKRDTLGDNKYFLTLDGSGNTQIRINRFTDYSIEVVNDAGTIKLHTYGSGDTNPHIFNYRWDGSAMYIYVDGVLVGSNLTGPTSPVTINSYIRLASNAFGTQTHDGFIGEFIWTDFQGDTDRKMLEGYLAHKWGVENNLQSNHPFRYGAPVL